MTKADMIARARSAIGKGTIYRLGAGAPFTAPLPADETGACDCSGFVCWVLGLPRHLTSFAWLTRLNGGWLNTDGIYEDALYQGTGFFDESGSDLIVYPSAGYARARGLAKGGPRIGHIGILSTPDRVIHCSAGNMQRSGDAIMETPLDVFLRVRYIARIKFAGVE